MYLWQHSPRRGGRRRRYDDRYLFPEALVSARDRLYISYIGRSIQDNRERLPSVLVSELCEYIAQSFCLPGDESLNVDDSARRVAEHLVHHHSRTPFAEQNFIPQSSGQSFASEWLPSALGQGEAMPDFTQTLADYQC